MHWILKDKKPVKVEDVLEWARWFDTNERHLGYFADEERDFRISTVFLGLSHDFDFGRKGYGETPQNIFETMIFTSLPLEINNYQVRYDTWEEAMADHEELKNMIFG